MTWAIALLCLFGTVVWTKLTDWSSEPGEYCRIERAASPPGLGKISREPESGLTALEANTDSGRGIAVFEHEEGRDKDCGPLLVLNEFKVPRGYEARIFKRDADGKLHYSPIKTAWLTASVYDLDRLLPGGVKQAQEWGLSVLPIDPSVEQAKSPKARITFSAPALSPATVSTVSAMFMTRWTQFRPWSGKSINVISDTGGDGFTWRRPTFIVGLSLLLAMAAAITFFRVNRRELVLAMVPPIIVSWLIIDVSWQHNLNQQRQETALLYQNDPNPTIWADQSDRRLAAIAEEVKGLTVNAEVPILIVAPDPFRRARLFYHLLPRNAVMVSHGLDRVHYERSPERLSGAYVVVIAGSPVEFVAETGRLRAKPDVSIPVKVIVRNRDWMLLRISPILEDGPSA